MPVLPPVEARVSEETAVTIASVDTCGEEPAQESSASKQWDMWSRGVGHLLLEREGDEPVLELWVGKRDM